VSPPDWLCVASSSTFRSLCSYLFSIESEADVREYLFQLLDSDDGNVKQFVEEICLNWQILKKPKPQKNEKQKERVCIRQW
jgi:hypothetical protein